MLKSHEKFHSSNGKRLVLVAEDEEINRELLGSVLKEEYEVIFAADGLEALQLIQEHQHMLSIILLDLIMPGMGGLELLEKLKDDLALQLIPVIVLTADQESEIKALTLGAADFLPKPYPPAGVILARIRRTIELFEDRLTIQTTERDPLTNLYNREFFYHYAELFDQYHESLEMDAIVIDIYHFRVINERFGNSYGDTILKRIGLKIREMVSDTGGIVCRREADTFMIYCPHGKDYKKILDSATDGLAGENIPLNRIRLRMGVYEKVDRAIPIERRFDRAKMAADMIRNTFTRSIEIYDHKLHEREIYLQQLLEDFQQGLSEEQFVVYFQPKFDIRPKTPVLLSAEGLVRWSHPKLGFIPPDNFIPLLEENGLIEDLDYYVWNKVAAQIRDWKTRLGLSIPVSVNVSRVDMYDPGLEEKLRGLLEMHDLEPGEMLLEVTESAYTKDSDQIIATVNNLRKSGFRIEMDDFGNGYSSLNMLSKLPIDALKLDMEFVQNAFRKRKDTRMLEIIVDIADYLGVPVIAEGVETEEQMEALQAIGCDIAQGYYFSRPVPAEEFEVILIREKAACAADHEEQDLQRSEKRKNLSRIANALSSGYEMIYYIDMNTDHYVEFTSEGRRDDLKIDHSGNNFFVDVAETIRRTVYADDQEEMIRCMEKEKLQRELENGPFMQTFRMFIDGEAVYYNLKAVKTQTIDKGQIVIGISNIDHEIKTSRAFEMLHRNPINFNMLANALTSDTETIYYVDVRTDTYRAFKTEKAYGKLPMETTGRDFFREFRQNLLRVVYEPDLEKVISAIDKETLLEILHKQKVSTIVYRVVIDGEPVYYHMKAVSADGEDNNHIIIGITNINGQIREGLKETGGEDIITFAGIAKALSQDYFGIYIVDTFTDDFYEYKAEKSFQQLGIAGNSEKFFDVFRRNAAEHVFADDRVRFLHLFTKENILKGLRDKGVFMMAYRLIIDGTPTFVSMKITYLGEPEKRQIVVGINNINAGMEERDKVLAGSLLNVYSTDKNEQKMREEVIRQISRDALTGVRSRHSYIEDEREINEKISAGTCDAFGLVFCDLNGLKYINDTYGHTEGDEFIREACHMICNVYKHSPVYRVGGDEFIVLLRGEDFKNREYLIKMVNALNYAQQVGRRVVVACGMAEYCSETDESVRDVYKRADAAMYENKKRLKQDLDV